MATKEEVIGVLRKCYDPEIPINIYDLGLVYNIELKPTESKVDVRMTLTAPGCPASAYIHQDVKRKLEQLPGVKEASVNIVWDPRPRGRSDRRPAPGDSARCAWASAMPSTASDAAGSSCSSCSSRGP